jgi:hypothetical protein
MSTRFHLGEHLGAATLRLGLILLFGLNVVEIMIYETLVVAVKMFHHANVSLGRFDELLRFVIVTPRMHQVQHSRWRPETDSNYSTLFSIWDRLFRMFRMRAGNKPVERGLGEFEDDAWQTAVGMLRTLFAAALRVEPERQEDGGEGVCASAEDQFRRRHGRRTENRRASGPWGPSAPRHLARFGRRR